MLTGADYNSFWDQLIMQVLRTDNAEQQDMLRYSIITSYIGRFGAVKFESMISTLLKWKGPGKDYYGYYTSIWKGLFTGKYGCNLLSLNVPLINEAPITYWNLFYDIAVCKIMFSLWMACGVRSGIIRFIIFKSFIVLLLNGILKVVKLSSYKLQ